jgi:hypothetical protein
MMAAIILACVFALGMTTAVFSETFVVTSMDSASAMGLTGTVEILAIDELNNSIPNVNISIDGINSKTNESGYYSQENVKLGILTLEISADGYTTQTREILVTPLINLDHTITLEEGDGKGDLIEFDATGCTLILIIFSVFALFSTIVCLRRQHFDVAVAGSLLSILTFGFFLIGSILSIIAFVIIMKSKEEFENGKKGKIF